MSTVMLSPEQEQQAQALATRLRAAVDGDILELARLLVSKPEHEVFGQTEFEARDIVHQLGATALDPGVTSAFISAPGRAPPPSGRVSLPREPSIYAKAIRGQIPSPLSNFVTVHSAESSEGAGRPFR